MVQASSAGARAIALVGPAGAGKTTLLEAMMLAGGGAPRQGDGGAGSGPGHNGAEARRSGQSVDLSFAGFEFLGDHFAVVDCPGSGEFNASADLALSAVDLVIVVVDPQPAKAVLAQPMLQALQRMRLPHALFINKIDQARGPLGDLIRALEAVSAKPLVVRQLPLFDGDRVNGFVDLALERAFVYRPGRASDRIDLPADRKDDEADARFHMLEQLADFDDELLEQLLTDAAPSQSAIFADLIEDVRQDRICPVFLGSALNGFGVRRLLKAIRHEAPASEVAARRLKLDGPAAYIFGVSHAGQSGKLALGRLFNGELRDGAELTLPDGAHSRAGGLFAVEGGGVRKIPLARGGEIVAIAKIDAAQGGQVLSADGRARAAPPVPRRPPLYALSIEARDRKDDVRLSAALEKLLEEDGALSVRRDPAIHQTLLEGQGPAHLEVALDRLARRFGLQISSHRPEIAYRESIRKSIVQRGRHKKQTGGHGQFGDVLVEIGPAPRGAGFVFSQRITGGAVPKQWIPAVEQGLRDALERGPLGFPVVDVAAVLIDGSYHSVDSSEMAFRTAGRLAMSEGLRQCAPYLLEPIETLLISTPGFGTAKVVAAVSGRRGHIEKLTPKAGWPGWDEVEAEMPEQQRQDFIIELRSLTQGLGSFEFAFDHLAELTERLAEDIVRSRSHAA